MPLDQRYFMCYCTWQVRARNFSDRGTFSAVFLFLAWQFLIKPLGVLGLEGTFAHTRGKTAFRWFIQTLHYCKMPAFCTISVQCNSL